MIARRIVLGGLLGAALPAPLIRAETTDRIRRIGFMGNVSPSRPPVVPIWRAFREELRERGWREGQNLVIEARWAEGNIGLYPAIAEELIGLNVEVIVALGSDGTDAARKKTATIPIVMLGAAHPIESGFVESLARPGGNITGLANLLNDLSIKHLELLKEFKPEIKRVAVFWSPNNSGSALAFRAGQEAGSRMGLEILSLPIVRPPDIDLADTTIAVERAHALQFHPTPSILSRSQQCAALALRQKLPAISGVSGLTRAGVLAAYGADLTGLWRRSAFYVDRILRGSKPTELPVEQPSKFELVINMKTAQAIGITIPESLVLRADELIE